MASPTQLANRETWRQALLSGDYQQTRNNLRHKDDESGVYGYCCLGVALDVLGGGAWQSTGARYIDANDRENLGDVRTATFNDLFGFEPSEFVVPEGYPFSEGDVQGLFINANDTEKATFEEIAALIPTQEET